MGSPSREAAILSEKFPDNVSISDLCDCGRHKRRKEMMPKPRRLRSYPDTSDYKATFTQKNIRPRSSKRPAPSPRETNRPPMSFSTNQRDDFKGHETTGRPPDFAPKETYEPPAVPLEKSTYYTQEYVQKQSLPEIRRFEPPRENFRKSSAKFDGRTTYRDHHKHWVGQKQVPFGELPSFAGSILFPSKEHVNKSVTKESYQGEFAKRPDLIRLADAHIKLEGDILLQTTHRDTYKEIKGVHRPTPIVNESDLARHKPRGKFEGETQFRHDFPGYGSEIRPPPPARPAPDTLDLKFDNKRSFETEQRKIYRGHDVLKNPVPKSCKLEDEMYRPPHEPMEAETCNRRDYRPIDLSRAYMSQAVVPTQTVQKSDAKFDDHTSTKDFFKNWGTNPRVRYGDFHENRPYLPPRNKFEAESVAKASFTPKKYERVKDFAPDNKPVAREGTFDFNTVTHTTYQKPEIKPCRAAIYLMQQELKRQKGTEKLKNTGQPTSLTIAAKS